MPEINEVKRYADFLRIKLQHHNLEGIKILKGRYKSHKPFDLYDELTKKLPLKIIDVNSKGKFLYITLDDDYFIFATLGLTGGWVFHDTKYHFAEQNYADGHDKNALNNLNVEFKINNGSMFFYDQMSYGTLKVIKGRAALNKKLNTLGPDIMDINTSFVVFKNQIRQKKYASKAIGNVLMDQKMVAGIGNYLRADVLWMSKISPFRHVSNLNDGDLLSIYKNVRILTWGDYNKDEGIRLKIISKKSKFPSDYDRNFFVYQQDKDIDENAVEIRELFEGSKKRVIYWVPTVQK